MSPLVASIIATVIVSLIALVGIFPLLLKKNLLNKIIFILVAFSAGSLLGGAMLHLLPEAVRKFESENIFIYVLVGFSLFFIIERLLRWHHCHKQDGPCEVHTFTYMNLIGDGVHNFVDGLIIAAAFAVDFDLGLITTLVIISHEIPQEIGDFAVLIYGGFTKFKALAFNFLSAIFAILGAIIGSVLASNVENFLVFLIPFAAGNFIYIAASDLIPELHKEKKLSKALMSFTFFILGLILMYGLKVWLGN